eukprot:SAG11_NODE_22180_length_409_cov_2.559486_1_plen_66_part_10
MDALPKIGQSFRLGPDLKSYDRTGLDSAAEPPRASMWGGLVKIRLLDFLGKKWSLDFQKIPGQYET